MPRGSQTLGVCSESLGQLHIRRPDARIKQRMIRHLPMDTDFALFGDSSVTGHGPDHRPQARSHDDGGTGGRAGGPL